MNEKSKLKQSDRLFEAAKRIFGDIVVSAYVSTWLGNDCDKDLERLKSAEKDLEIDDNSVRHDAETVAIGFSNGAIVYFENSEWGSFGKLNREDIEFVS